MLAKPAAAPKPSPLAVPATNASSKDACPRCRQGFFCSEHGILLIHIFYHQEVLTVFPGLQQEYIVAKSS